ncbi:MAG: hypothetical protein AAGC55_16820, partial [Myxococcota bacterium]
MTNAADSTDAADAEPSSGRRSRDLRGRWLTLTWLAIAALGALHVLYYWPRTVDDMFIFLRYAENAAAGLGLVYNPGERIEGFSSPLWTALLIVGELCGVGGVTWSKILAVAALIAMVVGTERLAREVLGLRRWASAVACLFLVLNSYVVAWTMWGLETPAYLALLLWTAVLARRLAEGGRRRDAVHLAWVASGLALARPEAPLFLALIGLAVAVRPLRWTEIQVRIRRCAAPAAVAIVAYVGFTLFRYSYFGLPLPHTYYAKQGGGLAPSHLAPLVAQGASPAEVALVAIAMVAALWLAVRRRAAVPLLIIAGTVFFVSKVELDWMPNVRHFLPLWLIAAPVALAAAQALLARPGRPARLAGRVVVLIALASAVLIVRVDARYSPFDQRSHGQGKHWIKAKSVRAWADTWASLRGHYPPHVTAMGLYQHGMITQLYRVLEADARPLAETWYISRDIGRVGWLTPVRVFEYAGLFTPDVVAAHQRLSDSDNGAATSTRARVDDTLLAAAFDRPVVMTELFGEWARAARRSPRVHKSYQPLPGSAGWSYLVARERTLPTLATVAERYRQALAKMPDRYHIMTLYGVSVGGLVERRVAHVQTIVADNPSRTVSAVPDDVATWQPPVVFDRAIELLGCAAQPEALAPGDDLLLTCYFRAIRPVRRSYSVFVHVEQLAGDGRFLGD